ncbi:chymotrypsinogen A-like [Tubulanus polymorphus]|uniref:chymotrypsinogen A-like n=1 Tax=Tubulanus polymorphus TaxID=672921 RepID=UPI003DA56E59
MDKTLILVVALMCSVDLSSGNWKIFGGIQVLSDQAWPHQVSLQYNNRHACGGSILDRNTILTAAHCFQNTGADPYLWRVVVGTINLRDPMRQIFAVQDIRVHELYQSPQKGNDVAIVKLSEFLQFSPTVTATQLPSSKSDNSDVGTTCYVSGWGYINTPGPSGILSDQLTYTDLQICNTNWCTQYFADAQPPVDDSILCVFGLYGKNACIGDSGGALMCPRAGYYVAEGIVSWGRIECGLDVSAPVVYTRVSHFLDWIEANRH